MSVVSGLRILALLAIVFLGLRSAAAIDPDPARRRA